MKPKQKNQILKDSERLFNLMEVSIDLYRDLFGIDYQFSKYDMIFVPNLTSRAMENPGAVVFNEQLIFDGQQYQMLYSRRDQTFVHELCHMWFGNLVTMKWWDDLWLSESFADFMALRVLEKIVNDSRDDTTSIYKQLKFKEYYQQTDFRVLFNLRKGWGYSQDQTRSTHPIQTDCFDT